MNTTKLHDHLLRHLLERHHHHLEAKHQRQRQTRRQRRRTSHAHFLLMATRNSSPPGDFEDGFPGIHPRPTFLKSLF